jgi:hypothetical protein
VIKSKRIRWEGHVTYIGEGKCLQCLVGKHEGKKWLDDLGVEGRIKLKGIVRIRLGEWTVLIWLRIGSNEGYCEHDDEYYFSVQRGEFIYWL